MVGRGKKEEGGFSRQQIKQVVALVVVAAMVGFFTGKAVERSSGPVAPDVVLSSPPESAPAPPPQEPPQLTYYDSLVKGKVVPLGSGLNPSEEEKKPVPAEGANEPAPAKPKAVAPVQAPVAVDADPIAKVLEKRTAPKTETADAPAAKKRVLMLQAGSFKKLEDAETLRARLKGKGYPARVTTADLGEKGVWYRVVLDPYTSMSAAVDVASRLKKEEKLSVLLKDRE